MAKKMWPIFNRGSQKREGQPWASGPSERERDSQLPAFIKGETEYKMVKEEIDDAVPGTSATPQQKDEIREIEYKTVKEVIDDAVPGTSATPQKKDATRVLLETIKNFGKLIENLHLELNNRNEENTELKKQIHALEEKIKVMKPHVVTLTKNTKLKNVFSIVKLNNENCKYHYCAICRQKISYAMRFKQLKRKHPQCRVIFIRYCPNSINFLNLIKEFGKNSKNIKIKQKISKYENKYFSLCNGYTQDKFLQDVEMLFNPSQ